MQNNETKPTSKTPFIAAGILGLAILGGIASWAFGLMKTTPAVDTTTDATTTGTDTTATTPARPVATGTTPGATTGTAYRDGTYTQTGSYGSPAGQENVEVTLTLKGDVVTATSFKGDATNPASVRFQQQFASAYKPLVVGKKISEISLGAVNGSSLTPQGFMDALAKIETQARS